MAVGHRVVNTVMGCFAEALPAKCLPPITESVTPTRSRRFNLMVSAPFTLTLSVAGAMPRATAQAHFRAVSQRGQFACRDDRAGLSGDVSSLRTSSGLRRSSQHRGGLGLQREFRLDAPKVFSPQTWSDSRPPHMGSTEVNQGAREDCYCAVQVKPRRHRLGAKSAALNSRQGTPSGWKHQVAADSAKARIDTQT